MYLKIQTIVVWHVYVMSVQIPVLKLSYLLLKICHVDTCPVISTALLTFDPNTVAVRNDQEWFNFWTTEGTDRTTAAEWVDRGGLSSIVPNIYKSCTTMTNFLFTPTLWGNSAITITLLSYKTCSQWCHLVNRSTLIYLWWSAPTKEQQNKGIHYQHYTIWILQNEITGLLVYSAAI